MTRNYKFTALLFSSKNYPTPGADPKWGLKVASRDGAPQCNLNLVLTLI